MYKIQTAKPLKPSPNIIETFSTISFLNLNGSHGLTVYKNSSWSTVSMSLLSLKSKLPDPIDRYCVYILSYSTVCITLCIDHIVRFLLIQNILYGLALILPGLHLYRIRLLRPQRFQIEVDLTLSHCSKRRRFERDLTWRNNSSFQVEKYKVLINNS